MPQLLEEFVSWSERWDKKALSLQFTSCTAVIGGKKREVAAIVNSGAAPCEFCIKAEYQFSQTRRCYNHLLVWFQPSFYIAAQSEQMLLGANAIPPQDQSDSSGWWGIARNATPHVWNFWLIPLLSIADKLCISFAGLIPIQQSLLLGNISIEESSPILRIKYALIDALKSIITEFSHIFQKQLKESDSDHKKNTFCLVCLNLYPTREKTEVFDIPFFQPGQEQSPILRKMSVAEISCESIWRLSFCVEPLQERYFLLEKLLQWYDQKFYICYEGFSVSPIIPPPDSMVRFLQPQTTFHLSVKTRLRNTGGEWAYPGVGV